MDFAGSRLHALMQLVVTAGLAVGTLPAVAGGPARFMMATYVGGRVLEGQPLAWTEEHMLLLGRDGQLHEFDPRDAEDSEKIGTSFRGYSVGEMRSRLREEFDKSFDISPTQHFVVVHPRGEWRGWAERLESLYRSVVHYMQVRGFSVETPVVPLVAVVFRNKTDYYRYVEANGSTLQPGTVGHYDGQTNRIFLFDASGRADSDWAYNAETIIHEATHQTAYNVGVHQRFAEQPRWLVEGLAMMFEARGVWDARSIYTRKDRINRERLQWLRSHLDERSPQTLVQLIAGDQLFRTDAMKAYAEAWVLSFFLCETQPRAYCDYLERVGSRRAFSTYSPEQRVADFTRYFGSELDMLDAQLLRFVEDLK